MNKPRAFRSGRCFLLFLSCVALVSAGCTNNTTNNNSGNCNAAGGSNSLDCTSVQPGASDVTATAKTPTALPASTQASGSITYPTSGAANVPSPKTLTAAGTVQHLEPGHHLLVFLQFGDQQKYFGGDPDVVLGPGGHWSGTVCVGDPGAIALWLVDMGPAGFAALESPAHNYWGNGVPFLPSKLAPDVTILDRVSITAVRTATACAKHEPQYYG